MGAHSSRTRWGHLMRLSDGLAPPAGGRGGSSLSGLASTPAASDTSSASSATRCTTLAASPSAPRDASRNGMRAGPLAEAAVGVVPSVEAEAGGGAGNEMPVLNHERIVEAHLFAQFGQPFW